MCLSYCCVYTLQVYQQSQSSKKSIHRTIKDGCKSLQFYGNSYRMIPEGLHPQVCHLHMHIPEETTPKKGTKFTAGHAKGKQQSRLSFGLYQGHVPGTLKDTELLIWKQKYAMSDTESLNLQQAVTACVNPQKLLCLQEQSKIVDDSDTAECSSTTTGSQLSLDRWMEWQRAPVSTGHIGHSSTTNQLVNILQFTENVTVTPDFIMSYDMEMQMFLNHDDVLPSSSRQRNEEEAISSSSAPVTKSRPSDRKGKRRLCFDSEDEDFISNINKKQTTTVMGPSVTKSSKSSSIDVLISNDVVDSTSAGNEGVADGPLHVVDRSSIIPPPPNIDSLSWMDQLPLSQSPNRTITSAPLPLNYSTPVKTPLTATKLLTPAKVPNKDKTSLKLLPHTPVGTSSKSTKSVSVGGNKFLSPKQSTPASPKLSKPKLVATVRPSSQNNDKIVTAQQTKLTTSPKQVSLVGTPYLVRHSDGNQATNQPKPSTSKVKQTNSKTTASRLKKQSPSKSSPLHLKKKRGDTSINLVGQTNLKTPTKTSTVQPGTLVGRHTLALKSPSVGSPVCVAESPGRFDDVIDIIPESDMECEEIPIATSCGSGGCVKSNETEEDSFAVLHNKKKNIHQPSFLCTQLPPVTSPARTKRKVIDSSTDDDFTPVKKKGKFAKHSSIDTTQEEGEDYLDLEAEVSSDDVTMTEDNVEEQTDAYDVDDSFINDATQLPSKSPVNMQAIYKQSLISPNNVMFASKQAGQGAKYRMRISRGHTLLHHFMGTAGIKILPTDQSHSGIANESFTGSEAEEEFLPLSQDDVIHDDVIDVTPKKPSNRRAVIMLSESVVSPTSSHHQTVRDVLSKKTLFSPQKKPPVADSSSEHIIVSPSLIVSCEKLFFHF